MSWNIFYRVKNNEIEILEVLQGSRKSSKLKSLRKIKQQSNQPLSNYDLHIGIWDHRIWRTKNNHV
jgi:hypothetical protein